MEVRSDGPDVPAPEGGGDQVAVVRAWLRERGVDPGPEVADRAEPAPRRTGERAPAGGRRPDGSGAGSAGRDAAGRESSGGLASGRRRRRGRWSGTDEPTVTADGPDSELDDELDDGPGSRLDDDVHPEELARGIVLRKLAAQARTRVELERALHKQAVPVEAAAAVLDRMGEVGLVDDTAFARDWVASRQQRRHLSRTALRRELQTKGVDRDVIDDALERVDPADEHRAALDLARRRSAPMAGLAREVAYRRLGAMLARRGFSAAVTTRVLAEVLDGADDS